MVIVEDGMDYSPSFRDQYWKAAFGASMKYIETEFVNALQHSRAFCQHAGCKCVWASINLA